MIRSHDLVTGYCENVLSAIRRVGASEGIRTLDTHVGNVMLYQAELRSLPGNGEG